MRRSGNKEENKRILMDLDVVLKSHDCPYIVQCFGTFITNVSRPPAPQASRAPRPSPRTRACLGWAGGYSHPAKPPPAVPADGRLHCHGAHGHVRREAQEADAGPYP